MASVRTATEADIPALIAMGRKMHAESPRFKSLAFSAEKCEALIRRLLDPLPQPPGTVLVAVEGPQVVGMMGGFVVEHFFSHDRYASDLVVYVAPGHRGGSAFVRLVFAFEDWAASRGACEIVLGVSTELNPEATVAMYERLGYARLQGRSVLKRVA